MDSVSASIRKRSLTSEGWGHIGNVPPDNLETRTSTGDSGLQLTPTHIAVRAPKRVISDAALRVAKPAAKAYKLAIGGGLYLEVMPGGSKMWR